MAPWAQVILVICAVVTTVALVAALGALKRTAARAESVLHLVERELRPLASQVESLATDLRALSRTANAEVERIGTVVRHVEDTSRKVARVVSAVGALTRVGQYAGLARGVARGLDAFVARLRNRRH